MNTRVIPEYYIVEKAHRWLSAPIDESTRREIEYMLAHDSAALVDAFYTDLDFGTGGLRGIMGAGSNRINRYTIGMATQGLAQYIRSQRGKGEASVAIAFDSRNQSPQLARVAAEVLSANGIKVYLFDELRPTPLLSFTVRELGCTAGIVITASHNPPAYNGYKVYWSDGAQVVPPHDKGIIAEVRAVQGIESVRFDAQVSRIVPVPPEVEAAYCRRAVQLIQAPDAVKEAGALKIVYTPIHGAGITMVPKVLAAAGFSRVHVVEEQAVPDGNFSTVVSPNPEERAAMDMALALAEQEGAQLVLGTDPDTDRVGVGARDREGKLRLLNGNQAGSLLVYFQLMLRAANGTLPANGFVAKTIVTTDLVTDIARHYGVKCYDTLTGFKYIAAVIREKEGSEIFLCGGEESYGYLVGDFVRDKDGVISALAFAEMSAWCAAHRTTLWDLLEQLYENFGFYYDALYTETIEGQQGAARIREMMEAFRHNPPRSLGGSEVIRLSDVAEGIQTDLRTGATTPLGLPSSNVLQFFLEDGSRVSVRPSGTEPKIKFYFSLRSAAADEDAAKARAEAIRMVLCEAQAPHLR